MKTTIHQPSYWPWLGLLDKIAKSDKYIVLDDVAANKSSFQYRNKFFCNGNSKVISLPVNYKMGKKINELKFRNDKWKNDHLIKIKNYYLIAPYFKKLFPEIEKLYKDYSGEFASPFILETMLFALDYLNIKVEIEKSSNIGSNKNKIDLISELCKKTGTTSYLSGQGAKNYITVKQIEEFKKSNINLLWHNFSHPIYPQHKKFDFVSGLACLDLFFWNGKEKSREIFWKNIKR